MTLDFKGKISKMSAILLIVAAILTGIAAFTSLWRIDIAAPQYPEGMVMYIGGLKGVDGGEDGIDLEKINELNHYVGMAQIHPGDFWSSPCYLT
jgi:copper chaperone NosL